MCLIQNSEQVCSSESLLVDMNDYIYSRRYIEKKKLCSIYAKGELQENHWKKLCVGIPVNLCHQYNNNTNNTMQILCCQNFLMCS